MFSFSTIKGDIIKNGPTILTILAAGGVIATGISSATGSLRAVALIEKKEEELKHELDIKEKVILTWREWLPPVLLGTTTILSVVGANSINLRRNAAIASVYSITAAALKEYQAKIVETIGEKKEQKVRDDILEDKIKKNPPDQSLLLVSTNGDTLFYESLSGRYFKGDLEKIRKIINDINHSLLTEMWVSLNEVFIDLGLGTVDLGEEMGWSVDELLDVEFTAKLTENNVPCIALNYRSLPISRDLCHYCQY